MFKTKTKSASTGLTWKHKIGYGLGDAGGCLTFVIMGKYFSNYCINVLKIDEPLLAILLLVWNVWDFINDPFMGILMDKSFLRSKNPNGKFRPWLIRSAPFVCISFIALFSVPTLFEGMSTLIVLFGLKVLYEACYTMFNIPMGSLLSAMSKDNHERAILSSARGIGSGLGSVVPIIIMPIFIKMYDKTDGTGYFIGAIICAVIGLGLSLGHYFMTEERVEVYVADPENQDIKFSDMVDVFRVNRPFVALFVHGISICLMQSTAETISSFFYEGVYGDMGLMSIGMAATGPVMLIAFIIGPKIAKKAGLIKFVRRCVLIGSAMYILIFIGHVLFDIDPYVHMIISGVALGITSMPIYMQWGFISEVIDYNEMLTGKRAEGSIFGTFNLARRAGQTIAMSGSVWLLDVFGYNRDILIQSETTILGFKIIGMLIPGIVALGSWFAFKYIWNLNDETREKINAFKEQKIANAAKNK